jgi:hypothetical protein
MSARILCKGCQEIIQSFEVNDEVFCKCGNVSVKYNGKSHDEEDMCSIKPAKDRNSYMIVDDQGNEIVKKERPAIGEEKLDLLLKALKSEIDAMAKSSNDRRFSPATNQDLSALQEWILLAFEVLREQIDDIAKPPRKPHASL